MDINTNFRMEWLARFWDEIIEMCERRELPNDFQSKNKWINAGTAYRRFVEPLDIAHYYRMCKGKGNYLSDGRHTRHKVIQKWMEEKKVGAVAQSLPPSLRTHAFGHM
jgi:enhanced disease susceptibility 1 protein